MEKEQNSEINSIFDFSQVEEHLKEETRRRYRYVKRAMENEHYRISGNALIPIIEEVAVEMNDPKPPSTSSLYRWIQSYRESGNQIIGLIPDISSRGNRIPRILPEESVK